MILIKKYKTVIAILLTLLILISLKLFTPGFKVNARKWAEPSFQGSNMVTVEKSKALQGKKLFVNIGGEGTVPEGIEDAISINPDSILNRIDIIKRHEGPVILFSHETAVSVRVWMFLSELGYRNIFILGDNEALKYKFLPDSITRQEL